MKRGHVDMTLQLPDLSLDVRCWYRHTASKTELVEVALLPTASVPRSGPMFKLQTEIEDLIYDLLGDHLAARIDTMLRTE